MFKVKVLALVVVALMFCSVSAFSQTPAEKTEEKPMDKQMGKECMGGMMDMMTAMQRQMVATTDGCVIVLSGNKLLKYDKDLNLLKEAEIKTDYALKIDIGSMQDMVQKMKEKYGKKPKAESQDTEKK